MVERIQSVAGRYGWGVVIAAAPYANFLLMSTAFLAVYIFALLLQLLGIDITPPGHGGNILGWIVYTLGMICYGWGVWSYMATLVLVPAGFAWSFADMVMAKAAGRGEQYIGALTGLTLSSIPLLLYFIAVLKSQ